jgi:hypothetical protein
MSKGIQATGGAATLPFSLLKKEPPLPAYLGHDHFHKVQQPLEEGPLIIHLLQQLQLAVSNGSRQRIPNTQPDLRSHTSKHQRRHHQNLQPTSQPVIQENRP